MTTPNEVKLLSVTDKDKAMLDNLKKEIIRLGLQDNPSRTKIQEHYNRENMHSPNRYIQKFGSWKNTIDLIGFGDIYRKKVAEDKSKRLKSEKIGVIWANMSEDELLDLVIAEIRSKDINSVQDYRLKHDREKTPSLATIYKLIGNWKRVKEEYSKRYGLE